MKMAVQSLKLLHAGIIILLIICVSILNIHIPNVAAIEGKKPAEKIGEVGENDKATKVTEVELADPIKNELASDVAAQRQAVANTQQGSNPVQKTTANSSGGKILLYTGIGFAAIAAGALAAGSGGSSSSEVEPEPEVTDPPVGADLDGDNWHGRLILVDSGFKEDVTATVHQNGSELEITTSSAQKYGKKFIGTISSSAFTKVRDQDTGQDWTTFYQNARWNMIDLYDYVHNFQDLDRLYLTREAKQ